MCRACPASSRRLHLYFFCPPIGWARSSAMALDPPIEIYIYRYINTSTYLSFYWLNPIVSNGSRPTNRYMFSYFIYVYWLNPLVSNGSRPTNRHSSTECMLTAQPTKLDWTILWRIAFPTLSISSVLAPPNPDKGLNNKLEYHLFEIIL